MRKSTRRQSNNEMRIKQRKCSKVSYDEQEKEEKDEIK